MMEKNEGRKRLQPGRDHVRGTNQMRVSVEMRDGEQPRPPQLSSAQHSPCQNVSDQRVSIPNRKKNASCQKGGHFIGSLSHMFDVSVTSFFFVLFSEAPI